jgi:hypothetical protein
MPTAFQQARAYRKLAADRAARYGLPPRAFRNTQKNGKAAPQIEQYRLWNLKTPPSVLTAMPKQIAITLWSLLAGCLCAFGVVALIIAH